MKKIIFISLIALLTVSCDKEVFTGLVESGATEFGKVFISTNPGGYKIFIDNKFMNVTSPDTVSYLSDGVHRLTLKHDVYSDSSTNITISKNSVQSLSIDMMKNPRFYSKVICSTNPQGAKIFLNGQQTNLVTPAAVTNIFPGEFVLKFTKNNFRDDSVTMKVKGGQLAEIYRILEDTSRTVSYRTNNSGITSNMIKKVVVDKQNNKWIGTIDHGLMKFDGKKWTSYENVPALKSTFIQTLLVDKTGKLWVGTANGLAVFDGAVWVNYDDNLPSKFVSDLEEDVFGNIWIATLNGLVRYRNNSFYTFNQANTGFPQTFLSSVSSSPSGEIWVGSSVTGITEFYMSMYWFQYKASEMKEITRGISDIVKDIIVDRAGRVWSYHAADPSLQVTSALLKGEGQWSVVDLPLLFYLDINSFYVDSANNLWMCVNGGLLRYTEAGQLKVYDSDTNGFFSKQCTSFIIDQNGDGWLTTFGGGIAKLKKGTF